MNRMMVSEKTKKEKERKKKESIDPTSTPNGYDIKCGANHKNRYYGINQSKPKSKLLKKI